VFESGQFVGADRYGAFEQWEAQIQAPRDLATAVLQKQGSQRIGEIVSWLEGLVAVRRLPVDADPMRGDYSRSLRSACSVPRRGGGGIVLSG